MMGYEEKRVRALLKEHKAVFVRQTKHEIWKLPNGNILTLPSTPSDYRAWKNALSFLYAELDLHDAKRGTPGERREKKTRTAQPIEETSLEAPELPSQYRAMADIKPGKLLTMKAVPQKKAIKHPVHGKASPVKDITVDVSGLLMKYGGTK